MENFTQEYAILIIHVSFQSAKLLDKIADSEQDSVEREEYVETLEMIKDFVHEYIVKTKEEIAEEFRKSKASDMLGKLD
jgi:hypothetical protein